MDSNTMIGIGGIIASLIFSLIFYLVGKKKRYNKTLYCINTEDYMVANTGTFSDKMVVKYNEEIVKGNMWCVSRTFVNIEKTDVMCGDEFVFVKVPNGRWLETKICNLTENLKEKDIRANILEEDSSILRLYFKNLRENDGFVLQGLVETTETTMAPLIIDHRIPDLEKIKILLEIKEEVSSYNHNSVKYSSAINSSSILEWGPLIFAVIYGATYGVFLHFKLPHWSLWSLSALCFVVYLIFWYIIHTRNKKIKRIVTAMKVKEPK